MPPRAAPRRPPPRRRREAGTRKGRAKGHGQGKAKAGDKADDKDASTITSKIRSLLVGASVVVIVLGTFKMAMTLLDTGSALQLPVMENSSEPPAPAQPPAESSATPAMPDAGSALDDLADAGREAVEQYFRTEHAGQRGPVAIPRARAVAAPAAANDITGAITTARRPAGGKLGHDAGAADRAAA